MKKLILLIYLITLTSQGQVTIFNANFENNGGNNNWTDANYVGSWNRGNDNFGFGAGNYKYVQRTDWNGAWNTHPANARLETVSPRINLTGYDRLTVSLRFSLDGYTQDGATIFASNNDGATWFKLGKQNDEAVNWYNTTDIAGIPASFGGWTGTYGYQNWITASIDLPSQGFDNRSNIRFKVVYGSNASNEDIGFAFDDFIVRGYARQTKVYPDCGLGIGNNLELWLNTGTLAALADGDRVSQWTNISSLNPASNIDMAWTSATATGTLRPTYHDNPAKNTNFNPVVAFDGTNAMFGKSGFYSEDLYIVINPTATISAARPTEDVFLGDDYLETAGSQDVTGISINNTSARYGALPDIAAYNQGSQGSYGKAIIHPYLVYDRPLIFNARLNDAGNGMDLYLDGINLGVTLSPALISEMNASTFKNILNSRYWLGRSEFFGPSFTGDILEIMSFSQRKPMADKRRLESYLAVKYGITLGLFAVPAISLPHVPGQYFDANGNALWNAALDPGYTHNVTGIGRDDCSLLHQKQAKSVDPNTFITVALGDLYPTNSQNPNSFQSSGDFLMWGSTPSTLTTMASPVKVTLGPSLVTTFTSVTERTWKFKEISILGNDIPEVKISVETAGLIGLPALLGNDAYVMIIADDDTFTTNVETIFLKTNGTKQEAFYDFDGIKYAKFGVAHEIEAFRHIEFDGVNDYVRINPELLNTTGDYTISAWVNTSGSNDNNTNKSIVSKRTSNNDGFDFVIRNDNRFAMGHNNTTWLTSSTNTKVNANTWHYLTFIYEGGIGKLYIDGILDVQAAMAAPILNNKDFTIGARYVDKNDIQNKFKGNLDEIRVFSTALNQDQIRFLMNQELKNSAGKVVGTIIPEAVTNNPLTSLNWSSLEAYFDMNKYLGTHLNDASGKAHRGALINPDAFSIQVQTAPVPYISNGTGDWNTANAWKDGTSMFIPGSTRSFNGTSYDIQWNIAQVNHNLSVDNKDTNLLGLFVNNDSKLTVSGDKLVTVSHHLYLDGKIDLTGESQLIQTTNSDLVATSRGLLEKDQQGTSDAFNYNYWSSPVSRANVVANNNGYTLESVLKDGTLVNNPRNITFTGTNVRDGLPGNAITAATISGRWLYKYGNQTGGQYSNWQYVGKDGLLNAGEGWTMKGTGAATANQNYVFEGRPNNGDINLPINAGNDYLIGNPYPSAIDAHRFINDNPQLDGTLYFWEHWGGGSHQLQLYQGGYALYNYSGGVSNATIGTAHPDVNQGGIATKTPQRYVPVGQGFFVSGIANGSILFRNDQRVFAKESGTSSVFVAAPSNTAAIYDNYNSQGDNRSKLRIGFDSPGVIHRQLLLTVDPNASLGYDRGFDGEQFDEQLDDMSYKIGSKKYTIQGVNALDSFTELPLRVKLSTPGTISIKIDDLENVAQDQDIYLKDVNTGIYHDLRTSGFTSEYLWAGIYEDRFSIVFASPATLANSDQIIDTNDLILYTPAGLDLLHVKKGIDIQIDSLMITNMLGQQVQAWDVSEQTGIIKVPVNAIATGTYIVTMNTNYGVQTRKIVIE